MDDQKIEGYAATVCAFKQWADPVYKAFVQQSLKQFIDNHHYEHRYKKVIDEQNTFKLLITKDNKNRFYIYDEHDEHARKGKKKN